MSEQAGGHGLGALTHLVPDDATVRVLRDFAFDLAREAGELIVDERPDALGVADTKSSEVDVVTVMDQRSQDHLLARLGQDHRPLRKQALTTRAKDRHARLRRTQPTRGLRRLDGREHPITA